MKIDLLAPGNGEDEFRKGTASQLRSGTGGGGMTRGSDVGSWADKYQKSDHHTDRLVRTIVQYETATGQPFPDQKLIPANYVTQKTMAHVAALPDVVYVKTPSVSEKPTTYITDTDVWRRPSLGGVSVPIATARGVNTVSIQLQTVPPLNVDSTSYVSRPPSGSSRYSTEQLTRAASLPPQADLYRRRTSVSSTSAAYRTAPSHVRQRSYQLGLPPLPSSPAVALHDGLRRGSYSGVSPPQAFPRVYYGHSAATPTPVHSRHTTPERVTDGGDVYRVSSTARRPSISGASWSVRSRSVSRERSSSPMTYTGAVGSRATSPGTPKMSDTRKKIRKVLFKMSGDIDYYN